MLTIITEISLCIHFCLVVKHILWLLIGANNIHIRTSIKYPSTVGFKSVSYTHLDVYKRQVWKPMPLSMTCAININ